MLRARTIAEQRKAEAEALRARRRRRFRILVCLNGTDSSYTGVDIAAQIGRHTDCTIVLLFIRRIDQGLNTGGLQMRAARQNMLDWGLELPGIQHLKRGLDQLVDQGFLGSQWEERIQHTDVFGDPLGDNKTEYRSPSGKAVVLKLKLAPDPASGILDQYELGPYNLIIMGPPKRWRNELRAIREPSTVQKVAVLSPASVMTVRRPLNGAGVLLYTSGSERSRESLTRGAVLAKFCNEPVSLLAVANKESERNQLYRMLGDFRRDLQEMGITVEDTRVRVGERVPAILEEGCDKSMIVVADSGKSKLTRFLFGSVAFDVMGQSETPVLNIR